MKIIRSKIKLKKLIKNEKNLGFVPTMGGIHKGHISLIRESIKKSEYTVVSIFVNKQQFNEENDFKTYPRDLKQDIEKLKNLDIDVLYLPNHNDIYPNGYNKKIKINIFSKKLCGKNRPKHFEAVADVIERFIDILNPKNIFFGKKDMQQLLIVEDFIRKKYPFIKVVACNTIREKNGVALSSRNFLLTKNDINTASKIVKLIKKNKVKLIQDKKFKNNLKKELYKFGVNKIDYIEPLDVNKIIKQFRKKRNFKIFFAYYLRRIRLIDNI